MDAPDIENVKAMNRAIQKYIEDLVAENVVNNSIKEGDHIIVEKNKKHLR